MSTGLEQDLREFGGSHELSRPIADVMRRGDQLRRRRGKRVGLAASAVAMIAASALVAADGRPSQDRPVTNPPASRVGGLKLVNLSQPDIDEATKRCAGSFPRILDLGDPEVAIRIGELTVLRYRFGSKLYHCDDIPDGWGPGGLAQEGPWEPSRARGPGAELVIYGYYNEADSHYWGARPHMSGYGYVASDVVAVEIHIAGQTIPTGLQRGLFAFWSSDSFTIEEFNNATLVSATRDGATVVTPLVRFPERADWHEPIDPGDLDRATVNGEGPDSD